MGFSERYLIERKLGNQRRRKFGAVYLGRIKETGEQCVIKSIEKTEATKHLCERLRHEATFHFSFEGLPKILDVFESDNELFVVRSFVEGTPIDEAWKQLKKKERHAFLEDLVEQLISILDHLDSLQIVHCDLKPSNLLLDKNQKLHLIDFGLALRRDENNDRGILFPLGFAAPELILNRLHLVDRRTDYFALGILLWKLYSDRLPLTHPNPSVFTNLQLTQALPESPEISTKIHVLLAKLSAKHNFRLPPNQLPINEVDDLLKEGMNLRYDDLNAFLRDFKAAKRTSWFRT